MLAISSGEYTAIFTGLTALFGGLVAVVMVMGYQHGRHQNAMRRPIRVLGDVRFSDKTQIFELPHGIVDNRIRRLTSVRFSNRSNVDLRWQIDGFETRIFGAAVDGEYWIEGPGIVETKRHDGTTIGLSIYLKDGARWKCYETRTDFQFPILIKKKCWIRIRGYTADGQKIRGWKRVTLVKTSHDE